MFESLGVYNGGPIDNVRKDLTVVATHLGSLELNLLPMLLPMLPMLPMLPTLPLLPTGQGLTRKIADVEKRGRIFFRNSEDVSVSVVGVFRNLTLAFAFQLGARRLLTDTIFVRIAKKDKVASQPDPGFKVIK